MLDKIKVIFTIMQMMITVTILIISIYISKRSSRKIRTIWSKLQLKWLGIELETKGKLDPEANMLLMNHQSLLDIIVLEALHQRDLAWVAKKEIGDIPWFGHILKAPDMIMVQRESKSSLIKLIKDVKEKLDNNRTIAIFPEGTRTNGKKMRKFKAGSKIIAEKYNLKVQPIVLVGTRAILDTQNMKQKAGKVTIVYLPTITAEKKTTWYQDTEESMNNILNMELKNDI